MQVKSLLGKRDCLVDLLERRVEFLIMQKKEEQVRKYHIFVFLFNLNALGEVSECVSEVVLGDETGCVRERRVGSVSSEQDVKTRPLGRRDLLEAEKGKVRLRFSMHYNVFIIIR